MKYLVSIVFCLFLLSCNKTLYSNPIGIDIYNAHQITVDTTALKTEWNAILKENKLKGDVSQFMIKTGIDERTEKKYYYLISSSWDNEFKMATKLIKHNKKFYLNTQELIYIICHGCSTSYPIIYNNYWDCESRDMIKCKKIEVLK